MSGPHLSYGETLKVTLIKDCLWPEGELWSWPRVIYAISRSLKRKVHNSCLVYKDTVTVLYMYVKFQRQRYLWLICLCYNFLTLTFPMNLTLLFHNLHWTLVHTVQDILTVLIIWLWPLSDIIKDAHSVSCSLNNTIQDTNE